MLDSMAIVLTPRIRVDPEGNVWGRPVGVSVAKDGSLLVTDDGSGIVWRVAYARD